MEVVGNKNQRIGPKSLYVMPSHNHLTQWYLRMIGDPRNASGGKWWKVWHAPKSCEPKPRNLICYSILSVDGHQLFRNWDF